MHLLGRKRSICPTEEWMTIALSLKRHGIRSISKQTGRDKGVVRKILRRNEVYFPRPKVLKGYVAGRKKVGMSYSAEWAGVEKEDCAHWEKHPDTLSNAAFLYYADHEKNKAISRASARRQYEKRKRDPEWFVLRRLRRRLWKFCKARRANRMSELCGCDASTLVAYLQSLFHSEMSWANYGRHWHIDHKIPCRAFNLLDAAHQRACFHWSNLQPMLAGENIRKGDKLPNGTRARLTPPSKYFL